MRFTDWDSLAAASETIRDLLREGRRLEELGIAPMDADEMLDVISGMMERMEEVIA